MLRRTAAGAAASAAAAAAPSSSSCGPDYHEDHKHENGIAAKRPPAQRRRSASERTIMLVAAIAGLIVLSLARHFWSSASSPAFFSSTSASSAFARGLADPSAPSSLSASTILSNYGLFDSESQNERRYNTLWAEARAHATNVKLEKKAEKKKSGSSKKTAAAAATATTAGEQGDRGGEKPSSSPPPRTQLPAPPTLAYVTPWNPRGFEAALKFHKKITHVSPVWYQIVAAPPGGGNKGVGPVLKGGEGVDEKWLAEMRKRAPGTKILPRVSLELDRFALALLFGGAASHALSIGRQLDEEATKRGYDGWVLEAWPAWTAISSPAAAADDEARAKMLLGAANGASLFVKHVAAALHDHEHDHPMRDGHAEHHGLDARELAERAAGRKRRKTLGPRAADDPPHLLVLAVPPPPDRETQPDAHAAYLAAAERLHRHVDLWSLMSYDYNEGGGEGRDFSLSDGHRSPPPTAPLPWVRASALALARAVGDRRKVLTGVPLYAVSWAIEGGGEGGGGEGRRVAARDAVTTVEALERLRAAAAAEGSPAPSSPPPSSSSLAGRWDELAAEAAFDLPRAGPGGSFSRVWMPTLPSVEARLRTAAEVGTGLALWEIGQAPPAFFDLL